MLISKTEVEHIAHLARIELKENEKNGLREELSAILEFVDKLDEVNTEGVEPMTGGGELKNVMREDEQIDMALEGHQANIIAQVPEKKEGWVKVKAIFRN
jgi:aspartyl-tRNA(Asn)/glutamyl-tRNA(Gln) amidotransferase subunit C